MGMNQLNSHSQNNRRYSRDSHKDFLKIRRAIYVLVAYANTVY